MDPTKKFEYEVEENIRRISKNRTLKSLSRRFMLESAKSHYPYNFRWLGRPIIQYPQDIVAAQELIWAIKPDLIIETGIAHGGSLILSASILELIGRKGKVIGIDIDIRKHNRRAMKAHRMMKRITMIEGSSISPEVIAKVKKIAKGKRRVMVFLDSDHSHDHVLRECELYSSFVSRGSYLVVWDTVIEFMNKKGIGSRPRPWGKGDNPLTAARAFLMKNKDFVVDTRIENKLLLTVAPGGFLQRIR